MRLKLETKLGTGARLWSEGDTYRSTSAEDHFPAPTPTPTPTPAPAANLVWRQCALPGKLCDCGVQGAGAKVIRYGAPGDATTNPAVRRWDYAHMEDRGEAVLLCDPLSFLHRDPFPGHAKHCDCAYLPGQQLPPVATPPLGLGNLAPSVPPGTKPVPTPTPDPQGYSWTQCAAQNETCRCAPGSMVRYGWTGSKAMYQDSNAWFKKHPEVVKWVYKDMEAGAYTRPLFSST